MLCHECGKEKNYSIETFIQFNKKLCSECKFLDKYNLITKKIIKDKYLLKEEDYDDLMFSTHYMRRTHAYLYSEEQVKKKFLNKFKHILSPDIIVNNVVVDEVHEFFKQQKIMKKEDTLIKLLRKFNFSIEDIPKELTDGFIKNKPGSKLEIERYCKRIEMEKKLISKNLEDFLDNLYVEEYLDDQISFNTLVECLLDLKNKKEEIEREFNKNGINIDENRKICDDYIQENITIPIDELIDIIKTKEIRKEKLIEQLKIYELEDLIDIEPALTYINYGDHYKTLEETVETIDSVEWYYNRNIKYHRRRGKR